MKYIFTIFCSIYQFKSNNKLIIKWIYDHLNDIYNINQDPKEHIKDK